MATIRNALLLCKNKVEVLKGSSAKVTLYELSENIAQFERIAQKRSLYVSKCLVRGWQTAL